MSYTHHFVEIEKAFVSIHARLDALEAKGAVADPPAEPVRDVGWYPVTAPVSGAPHFRWWSGRYWCKSESEHMRYSAPPAWIIGPRLDIPGEK